MRKIIILSSVLIIAIAVIAAMYFSELSGNTNNSTKVLKYIPSDAALVLSFNNDESFYDIFSNYELFDAVIGEKIAAELNQLHALLLKQPALKELANSKKIFISFHNEKADSVDLLFAISLNEKIAEEAIEESLGELSGVSVKRTQDDHIYKLSLNTINKPFFLYITRGAAAGSFSETLLRRSVDPKSVKISKQFINEINGNGSENQNSPVTLSINHHTLPSFFKGFINGKPDGNSLLIRDMQGFSSLSMNFKSDALMFSGISTPDTAAIDYPDLFLHQRPVKNQLKTILPENTANSILFGVSDYKRFHSDLRHYLGKKRVLQKLENQISFIRTETGVDLDKDIKSKLSNEFAVVETDGREKIGIIKVLNGTDINFSLKLISQNVSENIGRFNHSNILYYYFGDPFKIFSRPYFAVIDNYLVTANTQAAVQIYLDNYINSRFIAKTKEFSGHDQFLANKCNILYFINNKRSERVINTVLKKGYSQAFSDSNYGLKNFYGLSWQWSSDGGHFQTNIYADYNTPGKKDLKEIWSFKLNARIATAPQTFKDGDRQIIMVEDKVNNLYALSDDGKKIWAVQIDGKILGSIYQLTDGTFLFNTARKLYRINTKGYDFTGFPVNLPFNASFGLTPTGNDPASLKIFMPAGSFILAYDGSGKAIEGWSKKLPAKIISDLKIVGVNNTNHLIAGTGDGRFFFFNYNGQLTGKAEINTAKSLFKNRLIANIHTNTGNSGIVTTDTAGVVYYVFLNGKITRKNTGTWHEDHVFDYQNVTGDENPEFIYLDKSQLSIYNQDGTLVSTYTFDHPVKNNLQFFTLNKDESQIGISSLQNDQLFLFDGDGNLLKGFPVKGINDFYAGYIKNDGIRYLLCGSSDNYLHVYKL